MAKRCSLILCGLGLLACGFPSGRAREVDPAALRAADSYSEAFGGLSMLVIKDDRVVYEGYHHGFSPDRAAPIFSGTKGFWCVAAAVAQQEGILDLDEPVMRTLPEWDADRKDIRIRDLLSFTAGIEPAFALHGRSIPDRDAYSVRLPVVRRPGEAFMYGPSELQIFLEVFRRKLARKNTTPRAFLTHRLLRPLGIRSVDFREDARGNPLLASGFRLTARQWAEFGRLLLHGGAYRGRQIVHADALERCFQGTRTNPLFGMGFWLNRSARDPGAREIDVENMLERPWQQQDWHRTCLSHAAPDDLVAAIGSGYQRLFIIRSENLIIVRQGRNARFSDARFLRLVLGDGEGRS
ncbi:MAG TPA: serine hydrolase [Chthoniobacterales bacterium]